MLIEMVTGEYRASQALTYRCYIWQNNNGTPEKITEQPGIRCLSKSITGPDSLGTRYFHSKYSITIPSQMAIQIIISANGRPTHNFKIPILIDEAGEKLVVKLKKHTKFGIEFRGKILSRDKKLINEFLDVQITDMSTVEKADEHGIIC